MKNSLFKGFTYLAIGSIIVKLLGGLYKILLTNVLGGGSIGVYTQLLPVYSFVVVLVSSGVPLGISKMMAKFELNQKIKTLKLSLIVFFVYSTVLGLVMALSSKLITRGQGNTEFWFVYCILAPAIVLSSLSAVLKGFFQSMQNFKPTAISNIFEQISKIVFCLSIIVLFVSSSHSRIIVAITGILVGEILSFLTLVVMKNKAVKYTRKNANNIMEEKINLADIKLCVQEIANNVLPIMLTGLILPLSNLIDSFLVVRLLNKNFGINQSIYLYGLQTGVVGAIIGVPTTVTFALISVLMPSLYKDFSNKNERQFNYKFKLAFKLILTITIPCFLYLLVYPKSVINLIYGDNLSAYNMNGSVISSTLLLWSSFNVVFACLATFFSMCLQARDNRIMPIVTSAIGMIVKLILEIIFVPATMISILSFTIAGVVGNLCIVALDFYLLKREKLKFIPTLDLLKIILNAVLVLTVSLLFALIRLNNVSFVIIAVFSIVLYLILCCKLKIFSQQELKYLSKSKQNS